MQIMKRILKYTQEKNNLILFYSSVVVDVRGVSL